MNVLKKIFSPSCLIFSLIFFIYVFYKSEIYYDGERSNYYFIYYIISVLLIIFSIITFYVNQKLKEYLIILIISIFISSYIFEGYSTFKSKFTKERIYKKETGKKYDTRSKIEIYNDLKKVDKNIKVLAYPFTNLKRQNKLLPLSGVSNSKTILCNANGYYAIIESDRYGFNNPDIEWDKKEIEYLIVGDSYAFGECVNRPNDIGSVLRTLSKKPILNLAYGGNGPLFEYATLREYLNSNVKKVLWLYYEGNDLIDLNNELDDQILLNYINDLNFSQNLKTKQNEIDNEANNLIDEYEKEEENKLKKFTLKFKLFRFIKLYNFRQLFIKKKRIKIPEPGPEFKKILELAKDLTDKNNTKLYFVYLPDYYRYKNIDHLNFNYKEVKKIVNLLDITFIDIHTEVFEKEKKPLKLFPFELSGHHYKIKSYKKIAETIYEFTKN